MAKKSNNRKSPRTFKYAGAAPKSKYVNDSINKWNADKDEALLKNKKIKNSHKKVMEKYGKAFHDLKDDAYWEKGKTAPKPCCAPPAAPPAPSTGWRKWIGYVIGSVSRFLKGII